MTTNILTAILTAYCHCAICCGEANQPTASGVMPRVGRTISAPRWVPFGSLVRLPGMGWRRVEDRTAMRYNGRYDVFMASHAEAKRFGKRTVTVELVKQ